MRSRRMARYVLTGLALAFMGLLPPAGQTDGLLSPVEPAEEVDKQLSPSEKVGGPLRFRLQEGDLFPYRGKLKVETTLNTPVGTIKMNYEIDGVVEQRVVEVAENGNGIIESKYKKFDVAMSIGGDVSSVLPQEEIDRREEHASREITDAYKRILNEPFKITMTPRGEIKKLEAKKFLETLKQATDAVAALGGFSFDFLDEASLKRNIIAPGLVYPKLDEYLWETKMQMTEKAGGNSITTDLKLNWSRQGDKVVKKIPSHILEFTGEGKLADGTASLQIEGVDVAVNLESFDMEGTVHISKEDLWPVKTKIAMGTVSTWTGGQCGSIQTVTVKIKQTGTSERLRPDEYDKL